MVEHKSVLTLAGIILEKAFDPDADICILARQVLRKNDHISSLEAENARLREALGNSVTAIDDWLNLYAPDHCDETRVEEAKMRVHEHGTLYYIAIIQEANLAALAPPPPP